jgi:hypothetical protein
LIFYVFSLHSKAYDIPALDTECLIEEEISQACMDYGSKLDELAELLKQATPQLGSLKAVADEMSNIKLKVAASAPAPDSPELRQALATAKQISAEKGTTSPEAKVAWEQVEEIASSGLQNSMGGRLDDECLVESAQEACRALDELHRVLSLQRSKAEATGGS